MSETRLSVPFLNSLSPAGFEPGRILLVEFEPHSAWYEASYSIAAQAINAGIRTDYHVFQHEPTDVTNALARLGVKVQAARRRGLFRLLDSYTVQGGLAKSKQYKPYDFVSLSLRLKEWKQGAIGVLSDSEERDILHIDDNDSLLATANSEVEILDFFQSRAFAAARSKHITFLHGFTTGVHSKRFHHRLQSFVDGILDFAAWENHGRIDQFVRVRVLRGTTFDSHWHLLRLSESGEVSVDHSRRLSTSAVPGSGVGEPPTRRLAAIMFTDLVGFTKLGQQDEERALKLRKEHQSLLRPVFAAHGGREVKTMGDGFLVEFASAIESVRCAVEIQGAITRWNALPTSQERIVLRVGIHVGDVIEEEGDIIGDAVNVASRIEPLAEPGGICLSGSVFDQVRNKLRLPIEKMGSRELKNVETPVDVYRVVLGPHP